MKTKQQEIETLNAIHDKLDKIASELSRMRAPLGKELLDVRLALYDTISLVRLEIRRRES